MDFDNGVVQQSGVTKGNVHGINYRKGIYGLPAKEQLPGDRAYRSNPLLMELFDKFKVKLRVLFRTNQYDLKKHPKKYKPKRQMVETFFVQMCSQLNVKRNYAKSYYGLMTRLTAKISAMPFNFSITLSCFTCNNPFKKVPVATNVITITMEVEANQAITNPIIVCMPSDSDSCTMPARMVNI